MRILPTLKLSLKTVSALLVTGALFSHSAHAQGIPVDPGNVYEQVTDVSAYVDEDIDGDGMPNWWELLYGFDPTDPSDAALDPDGDTLTNLEEYNYGTNPLKKDTDGGGVADIHEINLNKNPLDPSDDFTPITFSGPTEPPKDLRGDSDGDGISNIDEDFYGTDKHNIDTDGDGLNDFEELFKFRTNPLEPDTDFDSINDFDELKRYLTNPNAKDTDFDGLFDAAELFVHETNPTIWDTDEGGMSDYDEVVNESDPLVKKDDYQFVWIAYYGEKANDLFKSLERNKIDIYQGLNLTLEAIKPEEAKKMTIQFNNKGFSTEKDLVKLKVISPDDTGLYLLELFLELETGKTIRMTRFVEVKRRGEIIRRAQGQFNNIYSKFDFFDDQKVPEAQVEVLVYNDITEKLERYVSDIFAFENPTTTDENGTFVIAFEPGNYLIKIDKPSFGSKEILFNTDVHTLFSENVYLTYNYDLLIWGVIYIGVFSVIWYILQIIEFLRSQIRAAIEEKAKTA